MTKYGRLLCRTIAVFTLVACQSAPPDRPGKVGLVHREFRDPARRSFDGRSDRPLATAIWYPAEESAVERPLRLGPPGLPFFQLGFAAADAALRPSAQALPLVLLSHGTGGSGLDLSWLAEWLVARGYIVAAVTHHGNSIAADDLSAQGFFLFWERPPDLSRVLDRLLDDPLIGPRIDRERIGAAGFSLGGNTMALIAGGRLDSAAYFAFCEGPKARATSCELPPESPFDRADLMELVANDAATQASIARADDSFRDPRVRAAYAIAPAVMDAMPARGAREVAIPLRIVVGTADRLAPAEGNARHLARHAPGAELVELPGVGHYTFLSRCGWAGNLVLGDLCRERRGVSRAAMHALVAADAYDFFERSLR
jgi:predicted dienelactone hydrolase